MDFTEQHIPIEEFIALYIDPDFPHLLDAIRWHCSKRYSQYTTIDGIALQYSNQYRQALHEIVMDWGKKSFCMPHITDEEMRQIMLHISACGCVVTDKLTIQEHELQHITAYYIHRCGVDSLREEPFYEECLDILIKEYKGSNQVYIGSPTDSIWLMVTNLLKGRISVHLAKRFVALNEHIYTRMPHYLKNSKELLVHLLDTQLAQKNLNTSLYWGSNPFDRGSVPSELRGDLEVALKAVELSPRAFYHITDKLRNVESIVELFKVQPIIYGMLSKEMKNHPEILTVIFKNKILKSD